MKKFLVYLVALGLLPLAVADSPLTHRELLLANSKVSVWRTIIYPSDLQKLKMHRHDHPRVVVALSDGELKIINNKGLTHILKLKKDRAYYLQADVAGELHTDQNTSGHLIKVVVIELK